MSEQNMEDIEIKIAGKVFKLKSDKGKEYFIRLESYINEKISNIKKEANAQYISADAMAAHVYVNIANDYFKERQKVERLQDEHEQINKELIELKHDIVDLEMRLEELEK